MRFPTLLQDSDNAIYWPSVVRVHMESDGRNPAIVLTYRHGGRKVIGREQAVKLWANVEQHKGCPAPCFYRHECESAPIEPACVDCQLAEVLAGLELEQRPDPVRLSRFQVPAQGCLFAVLLGVIVMLVMAKGGTSEQSPTLPKRAITRAHVRMRDTHK